MYAFHAILRYSVQEDRNAKDFGILYEKPTIIIHAMETENRQLSYYSIDHYSNEEQDIISENILTEDLEDVRNYLKEHVRGSEINIVSMVKDSLPDCVQRDSTRIRIEYDRIGIDYGGEGKYVYYRPLNDDEKKELQIFDDFCIRWK